MVARYILISGSIAMGVLTTTPAMSQENDTFCDETGAMIVSADPIADDIRNDAYSYANGDEGAPAVLESHGLDNNTGVSDGELIAVVTAFGMAAVLSSATEANRLLSGLDCARFNIRPLD